MKSFNILKRLVFLFFALIISSLTFGQAALSGKGTKEEPWEISSVDDWNAFAEAVNRGYDYSGKFIKLMADIGTTRNPITTMVGVWNSSSSSRKPFSGTLLGDNRTITVNYTSTGSRNYTAPFACTKGATINKIHVAGTINAANGYAAGVIGGNYSSTTKINGEYNDITVNIIGGGPSCGGIAVDGTRVETSSCAYHGRIVAGNNSAGFCAKGDGNTKFFYCLFAPARGSSITRGENFANENYNAQVSKKFYYTYPALSSAAQGTVVYASYDDVPEEGFWIKAPHYDGNEYFVGGEGELELSEFNLLEDIHDNGLDFSVSFKYAPTAPDNTSTVVDPSYYTARIVDGNNNVIDPRRIEPGSYILQIIGNEDYCKGRLGDGFVVIEGSGTEGRPYIIASTDDWNAVAEKVNSGESFAGKYFRLKNDITIVLNNTDGSDRIIGSWTNDNNYKPFSGSFDGNWHTIRFMVGSEGNAYTPVMINTTPHPTAPFAVIDGATIENLFVTGTIINEKKYNAGVAGFVYSKRTQNASNITNCKSSIIVDCSNILDPNCGTSNIKRWDCSTGGLVIENKSSSNTVNPQLIFTKCIFDGTIFRGTNDTRANRCAGFVSYNSGNNIKYTDCLMAGSLLDWVVSNATLISTFSRNGKITYSGSCLYAKGYGDVPKTNCVQAPTEEPDGVFKRYIVEDVECFVPVYITELKDMVYESSEPLTVDVAYYGKHLEANVDYTIVIEKKNSIGVYETVSQITGPSGSYRVTITAIERGGFEGSKVYEFRLISDSQKWYNLENLINGSAAVITLPNDFVAMTGDNVLEITRDLTINLNRKTIDRNLDEGVVKGQVIRIAAGVTVTINGPGTITGGFNVAENDVELGPNNDGGGIYNMGNLILNDVTVTNNKCIKFTEGSDRFTARGGGIFNGIGSSFVMTGGTVSNNVARGGGGGVYCQLPTAFSMTDVVITNNESESKGGGLRIRTASPVEATLTRCTIDHNRATETGSTRASEGGGIYMQEGLLRMEKCDISYNKSAFAGAGFYSGGGTTYAKSCSITNNTAFTETERMYGGGICMHGGTYTMDGGFIRNNHSFQDGGGVYIFQGARFNVLGNVMIEENFRTREGADPPDTPNNAYVAGTAVINIVGDLTPEARIHITGHGYGGIYTSGMKDYVTIPDNFVTDGKYQKLNDWQDLDEINLAPYEWYSEGTWEHQPETPDHIIPNNVDIRVDRAIELESGEIGYANSIEFVAGRLILKDGAQLICSENKTPEVPVEILVQKTIKAAPNAGSDTYGWYTISVPIDDVKVQDEYDNNTNLATSSFDLLRYDEPTHYWDSYSYENYQSHFPGKFLTTEKGRGYLYRNKDDINLDFSGKMNIDDVSYNVTANGDKLTGFNLIGNPFTHTIYKGDGAAIQNRNILTKGFYTLTLESEWHAGLDNETPIGVCQGILVQAKESGTITMRNTTENGRSSKENKNRIQFTVANNKYTDVAYAMFETGSGLNKIEHINENAPMVYIRNNDEDYAIASIDDDTKMFDLCFKAKTTGKYTLSVKPEGEYSYLHLVDRMAGKDIDLLQENEYSFIASINDNDDRFIVRLGENSGSDNDFAYQNGSDIVISGNGELQVFDVMGRLVTKQYINGVGTWHSSSSENGVFILKLVNGNNVKTQKIVVR